LLSTNTRSNYLSKFDSSGKLLWAKKIGNSVFPNGVIIYSKIFITDANDIILIGSSQSASNYVQIIKKIDNNGIDIWEQNSSQMSSSISTSYNPIFAVWDLEVLTDGIYILGYFNHSLSLFSQNTPQSQIQIQTPYLYDNIESGFLAKMDIHTGNIIWAKTINHFYYHNLSVDKNENILCYNSNSGDKTTSLSDLDFGLGFYSPLPTSSGQARPNYLTKLSKNGDLIWTVNDTARYYNSKPVKPVCINKNIFVIKKFGVDFEKLAKYDEFGNLVHSIKDSVFSIIGLIELNGHLASLESDYLGRTKYKLVEYDTDLNILKEKMIGSPTDTLTISAICGSQGTNVYLGGGFKNIIDFESDSSQKILDSKNGGAFLLKLSNDISTSITDEKIEKPKANVYPNPTSGYLSIELPSVNKEIEVSIHNIYGQKVGLFKASNTNRVDVKLEHEGGIYILYTKTDKNEIYISKIIKK
jgi:hypothetical protein